MVNYFIYKVTNQVNGKIYIGYTKNLRKRIIQHKSEAKYKSPHYPLYRAFAKYGFDNFTFDIIYCSKDRQHTLTVMEPYFIQEYNSKCLGYNQTLGGEGGRGNSFTMPDEAKRKISIAHTGKKLTQHAKDAISKSWIVISPDGSKELVFNLKEYCTTKNLCADNLYAVANGRRKHHKQYRCLHDRPLA